jgi:hypothetical protein
MGSSFNGPNLLKRKNTSPSHSSTLVEINKGAIKDALHTPYPIHSSGRKKNKRDITVSLSRSGRKRDLLSPCAQPQPMRRSPHAGTHTTHLPRADPPPRTPQHAMCNRKKPSASRSNTPKLFPVYPRGKLTRALPLRLCVVCAGTVSQPPRARIIHRGYHISDPPPCVCYQTRCDALLASQLVDIFRHARTGTTWLRCSQTPTIVPSVRPNPSSHGPSETVHQSLRPRRVRRVSRP